jgi:hypothetical protein
VGKSFIACALAQKLAGTDTRPCTPGPRRCSALRAGQIRFTGTSTKNSLADFELGQETRRGHPHYEE